MKNDNYITLVRMTALLSFIIGTLIFLLYKQSHNFYWVDLGMLYIAIAFIINSLILLVALIQSAIYSKEGPKLFFNTLLLLLNIPIVFIYISLLQL